MNNEDEHEETRNTSNIPLEMQEWVQSLGLPLDDDNIRLDVTAYSRYAGVDQQGWMKWGLLPYMDITVNHGQECITQRFQFVGNGLVPIDDKGYMEMTASYQGRIRIVGKPESIQGFLTQVIDSASGKVISNITAIKLSLDSLNENSAEVTFYDFQRNAEQTITLDNSEIKDVTAKVYPKSE